MKNSSLLVLLSGLIIFGCGRHESKSVVQRHATDDLTITLVDAPKAKTKIRIEPIASVLDQTGWSVGTCVSRDGSTIYGKAGSKRNTNEMYSKDIQVFVRSRGKQSVALGPDTRAVNPIGTAENGNIWLANVANSGRETGVRLYDRSGSLITSVLSLSRRRSDAEAISKDGKTIVGQIESDSGFGFEGFVWTDNNGLSLLGPDSTAKDVTNDGLKVCGEKKNGDGYSEAFTWTKADGFSWLGDLKGGNFQSRADCISGDGTVVIGRGWSQSGHNKLFTWSKASGMTEVEDARWSPVPLDTSDDGSITVGYENNGSDNSAFILTKDFGFEYLKDFLKRNDVDATDWKRFESAESVSGDGQTIVGTGRTNENNQTAFILTIAGG